MWLCSVCSTENNSFVCSEPKCKGKKDCCDAAVFLNHDRKCLIRYMRRSIIPANSIMGRTWLGEVMHFTQENEKELREWLADQGFEVIIKRNWRGKLESLYLVMMN